jgi:hypothetical protein
VLVHPFPTWEARWIERLIEGSDISNNWKQTHAKLRVTYSPSGLSVCRFLVTFPVYLKTLLNPVTTFL